MKKYLLIVFFFIQTFLFGQSNVNPDISLIGTFNTYTNFINGSPDKGKLNFEQPSMELFVDGYLNPFARATGNIAYEDGSFSVEELYANVVRGLPLDMQIKAGKYLLGFGKLNTVHPHAWPFLDRPLVHQIYFGPEGFNDIGVNLSFILPTEDFYSSIDVGIYKGDAIAKSEAADPESEESIQKLRGKSPIFVGRLGAFFPIGDYDNIDVGLSSSYGIHAINSFAVENNNYLIFMPHSLQYLYTGFDFKYKYKPDTYTSLTVQGEFLSNYRQVIRAVREYYPKQPGVLITINTFGTYLYFDYQFDKIFSVGAKYDFTYGIIDDAPSYNTLSNDDKNKTSGYSVWFGYYPVEETLALRFGVQYLTFSYADGTTRDGETTLKLQMLFSLGPHKAHPF